MTGRKMHAQQVPPVVPYKALGKFPNVLYGTMVGTCSACIFRSVMVAVVKRITREVRRARVSKVMRVIRAARPTVVTMAARVEWVARVASLANMGSDWPVW